MAVQSGSTTTPWQPGQVTVTATQASTTLEFSASFSGGGDGPTIGSASLTQMSPEVPSNQAAVAYAQLVAAASSRMAAQELTVVGAIAIKDSASGTSWDMSLFSPDGAAVPSGYLPATEQVTVAAKAGRVTWVSNVFVPKGCPSPSAPTCTKTDNITILSLLMNAGIFIHPVQPNLCWSKLDSSGSVEGGDFDAWRDTGGPAGYPVSGTYFPLHQAGATVVVTSTFPTNTGQTVTETDTVDAATHLPISTLINVAAATGHPGYTEHWVNRWLTTAPVEPQIGTRCTS